MHTSRLCSVGHTASPASVNLADTADLSHSTCVSARTTTRSYPAHNLLSGKAQLFRTRKGELHGLCSFPNSCSSLLRVRQLFKSLAAVHRRRLRVEWSCREFECTLCSHLSVYSDLRASLDSLKCFVEQHPMSVGIGY